MEVKNSVQLSVRLGGYKKKPLQLPRVDMMQNPLCCTNAVKRKNLDPVMQKIIEDECDYNGCVGVTVDSDQSVWTTIEVSSIHADFMSRVKTRDTLERFSPPSARRKSRRAKLFDSAPEGGRIVVTTGEVEIGMAAAGFSRDELPLVHTVAVSEAQSLMTLCCPSPSQRSANPSEVRIKKRGRDGSEDGVRM